MTLSAGGRHSVIRLTVTLVAALAAGCSAVPAANQVNESPPPEVVISGALFVDMDFGRTCGQADVPPELSGVTLTFTGPDGEQLGQAVTGGPGAGPVNPGDNRAGCRYFTHYSAKLPRSPAYTVGFTPAPRDERGTYFSGVDELQPQTASWEELESSLFAWDFEVGPSYVVGH